MVLIFREHRLKIFSCFCLLFLSACQQKTEAPAEPIPETITNQPAPKVTKPTILVAGVTGRQGRALATRLLELGYSVKGTTRNPESDKAKDMMELGVNVVRADFSDPDSLRQVTTDVYGLFFYTPNDPLEVIMGKNVADAAKTAGVKHIIYTTYLSADPENGYPGEQAKRTIENYVRNSGIGYTFLRPVSFMENFDGRKTAFANNGISAPQAPDHIGQYISVRDIAFFAAEAFEKPGEWMGVELNIASDEMTQSDAAALFSRLLGVNVSYNQISWDQAAKRMPPQLIKIFQWYETSGFKVDVASLRERYPNLLTLEEYLQETGWNEWQPAEP